jgi:hypothetical protein
MRSMPTDGTRMRRPSKTILALLVILATGCASPSIIVETAEPSYRNGGQFRIYIVDADGSSIPLATSDKPSLAIACEPYGTAVARAVNVDGTPWVEVFSISTGDVTSSYKLSVTSASSVELLWPMPPRLVALSGDKLHVIIPGKKPENAGFAKGLIYAPIGFKAVLFDAVDVPEKSPLGQHFAAPEGLRPLVFTPRGTSYLALDEAGTMYLCQLKSGSSKKLALEVPGYDLPRVVAACYSADGKAFFVTAAIGNKMGFYRGQTSGPKAYSTLIPVDELGIHQKLEIAGVAGGNVFLVADDTEVLRYAPGTKAVDKVFSTGGRINAFCIVP